MPWLPKQQFTVYTQRRSPNLTANVWPPHVFKCYGESLDFQSSRANRGKWLVVGASRKLEKHLIISQSRIGSTALKAKWRLIAKISEQRSALPYAVMTWMPPAKRRVGRPKVRWTDSVNDFLLAVRGESLIQCLRHPHSNFWKEQEKAFIQHTADTV